MVIKQQEPTNLEPIMITKRINRTSIMAALNKNAETLTIRWETTSAIASWSSVSIATIKSVIIHTITSFYLFYYNLLQYYKFGYRKPNIIYSMLFVLYMIFIYTI